jgi:branched-chain amino acid transport system substrate-binding protein
MLALVPLLALAAAASDGLLEIGSYSAMSGGSAPMGIAQRRGAALAAEELNAAGGVLGRKVVIVEGDDEARADKGVEVVTDLLEKGKVQAVIGTYFEPWHPDDHEAVSPAQVVWARAREGGIVPDEPAAR